MRLRRLSIGIEATGLAATAAVCAGVALLTLYMAIADERVCFGCGSDSLTENRPAILGYGLAVAFVALVQALSAWTLAKVHRRSRDTRVRRQHDWRRLPAAGRLVVLVASVPTLLAAGVVSLFASFVASVSLRHPNPDVPDGDPCCGHPDTWGEVAGGLAYGVLLAIVAAGLLAGTGALVYAAAAGRRPVGLLAWPSVPIILGGFSLLCLSLLVTLFLAGALSVGDYP